MSALPVSSLATALQALALSDATAVQPPKISPELPPIQTLIARLAYSTLTSLYATPSQYIDYTNACDMYIDLVDLERALQWIQDPVLQNCRNHVRRQLLQRLHDDITSHYSSHPYAAAVSQASTAIRDLLNREAPIDQTLAALSALFVELIDCDSGAKVLSFVLPYCRHLDNAELLLRFADAATIGEAQSCWSEPLFNGQRQYQDLVALATQALLQRSVPLAQ